MQVLVLGPIELDRGGERAALGPRLQRLLAALVARRGSAVSSRTLADIVWDGDPPASAETTLRTYVTRLRNALETDNALTFRNSGYELSGAIEVDADVFVREIAAATLAMQTADHRVADDLLTAALGRWHGRPYGELGDEEWSRPERVGLEERRAEAVEMQVDVMLADGRVEQAVAAAAALAEEHPLRERPRELQMRALYVAGRRADAVRVFRNYRELLAEETGLDPSAELADLEGRILAGELPRSAPAGRARGYELGEQIGRGAFAVVHRAVQPGVGREVAVKIIRPSLADDPDFVRRFEHEAQLVAAVEHPHVVPLYDFWREPGVAYLVMRWMRGGNLARALRERGPLSRDQLARVLTEVGAGLHAAHQAGVLHRDVRPANLLFDDGGTAYLADFGIAVASTIGLSDHPVHYAAPEVLRGEAVAVPADIHSLGITVFEMLTGRVPLSDTTDRAELVRRQLTEAAPSVRATRSELPPAVDDVLARATSKVAGERHPSVPEFVDDMIAALGSGDRRAAGMSGVVGPNPYVGLHAFTEADADRFHGRDQLVGELADAVEQHRLVAVVGPSGSGKSSVVRAGLIPALRCGAVLGSDRWFVTTMFPGTDPIRALETALLRVAINPPASLRGQLAEDGGLLRSVRRVVPDDEDTVLVVIDQFEELFTVVESDEVRGRFLAELAHAIEAPDSPLRVVATLRADHYDAPLRDPAFAELVSAGTVTVRPMRPDELERTITEPARAVGVDVEAALVAELVASVADRPAALPLLQFALRELYERRVAGVMLLETHQSLGGLTGALAARAERIVERGDDADRARIRYIFGRLVSFGDNAERDARRRASLAEFDDDERIAWLIDEFVTARLLVVGRDAHTREPIVEVAHEALLRDWPRLSRWIAEDRADLRVHHIIMIAASEWADAQKDDGMLARGSRLELVDELATRRADLLNEIEVEWLERSQELATTEIERERFGRRRTRRALAATAVLLIFAVAAAVVALVLRDRASDSARAAEARELILKAEKAIADDPELAILLGLEAVEAYEEATGDIPMSAIQVLRSGIEQQHVRRRFPGGEFVSVIPDRNELATSDGAGGIAIWDLGDADATEPVETIEFSGWQVRDVRGEGDQLLAEVFGDERYTVFRIDVESGEREQIWPEFLDHPSVNVQLDDDAGIERPRAGTIKIHRLGADPSTRTFTLSSGSEVFNRDGSVAFATGDDEAPSVSIVDVRTWETTEIPIPDFLPQFVELSPSGDLIAAARQTGELVVVDRTSGAQLWSALTFERGGAPRWSPDGTQIVFGNEDNLTVVDVGRGEVVNVLDVHEGGTWEYEYVSDTGRIATAGIGDGATLVIDPREATETGQPGVVVPMDDFAVAGPSGTVILVDRRDYAVVDAATGRTLHAGRGTNLDPRTAFGFTNPVPELGGEYVTFNDGISRLRRVADGATVWQAPPEWSIRGSDGARGRVVITRDDPQTGDTETKIVHLRSGGEGFVVEREVDLVEIGPSIGPATFSPDGELVVTGSLSLGFGNWIHTVDGELVHEIPEDLASVRWGFSQDSSLLVGGTFTGQILVFDVERLRSGASTEAALLQRIGAHKTHATASQISADGTAIVSEARSEPARVWDIESGEMIGEFGDGSMPTTITPHPSERLVYVVDGGVLTARTLDPEELIEAARNSITRPLTGAECDRFLRQSCDR